MRPLLLLIPLLFLPNRDGYGAAGPTFEVASIKPNTSNGTPSISDLDRSTFIATNIPLQLLITLAYHVRSFQLEGAPAWISSDRFDISAKPPEGVFTREQASVMLQSLLEDRFKLIARRETKEVPVYAIIPAKNGIKIKLASEGACFKVGIGAPPRPQPIPGQPAPVPCGAFFVGPNTMRAGGISMTQLASGLTTILGRPVIDKSGFTGTFDVRLDFARDVADPDTSLPTIFTALQEQLGLKLESQKAPGEILVIDHAEKPSEN